MAKITYTDAQGTHTIEGVIETSGITIEDIESNSEWELKTVDDIETATNTDFIGGRPNDR